jgi:hypothetical protein
MLMDKVVRTKSKQKKIVSEDLKSSTTMSKSMKTCRVRRGEGSIYAIISNWS